MENNSIDIEEIMAEIKRDIKEKGLTEDMLGFEDVPYKKPVQIGGSEQADDALAFLNANCSVQPYKELKGNPLKVFFKKVIRKLVKFYVEPVVQEQNDLNINTVTVLNALSENKTEDISDRIATLELAQKELLRRIDKLERENESLRIQLGKQG